jgi:L-lactate dehydrogenase complex protein LldG
MEERDSRKHILEKIKAAKISHDERIKTSFPKHQHNSSEYLPPLDDLPEVVFARNLIQVKGKFVYCPNQKELILALRILYHEENWENIYCGEPAIQDFLKRAGLPFFSETDKIMDVQAAFTGCEFLVARTGSIMVSSAQGSGRRIFAHTPVHAIIARSGQLVPEIGDALQAIKGKYGEMPSQISMITGPSRTADIEKTLVMGVHGPHDLYVFLLNDTKT